MNKKYNVLIAGAGNIGAFFDNSSSENILTHAHAFSDVKGFNLLGFVDVSENSGQKAAKLWNADYYSSLEDAFIKHEIDVVSVCVPDEYHYDILKKISNYSVRLVFAEKPLAKNINQAQEIIKMYKEKNIRCLVNYSRRFVSEFNILKDNILKDKYGKFICGNGYYGKGTLHNGSHLIDLLRYLIGEVKDFKILNHNFDFYSNDPSVSASLNFEKGGNFVIQSIPCNNYTIFELELLFERRRIRIIDSGFKIEEYSVLDSKMFTGYKNLFKEKEYESELSKAMLNAVENIHNNLAFDEELVCTLEDGLRDLEVCEKLKAEIKHV